MAKAENPAPPKGGIMGLLLFGAVSLLAGAGGFAVAYFLTGMGGSSAAHGEDETAARQAFVPFGEVVVNLAEERLTRYLRVKLILVVDASQEKEVTDRLQTNRAILKNWLISHLSDRSLQDVSGAGGVNRLRREIQDQFNSLLFPDGTDRLRDVLFEEFVVQ